MNKTASATLAIILVCSLTTPLAAATDTAPNLHAQAAEKALANPDTVGWLKVPGTNIDDVVVCNNDPDDHNRFYERRNSEKA